MSKELINFGEFMKTNKSGVFIMNTSWLEYLLNLFCQGYLVEFWEEIQDTKINYLNSIERTSYGLLNLLNLEELEIKTNTQQPRHKSQKDKGVGSSAGTG